MKSMLEMLFEMSIALVKKDEKIEKLQQKIQELSAENEHLKLKKSCADCKHKNQLCSGCAEKCLPGYKCWGKIPEYNREELQ